MSVAAMIARRIRARSPGERSQSLVEFSVLMPILVFLIFGIIDFSMGLRSYVQLTNATREGARYAALGNPAGAYPTDCNDSATSVVGRVCKSVGGLDLGGMQTVSVQYPNGQLPGNSVVVSASYRYSFITPLSGLGQLLSGGAFAGELNLSASSDMRLE